MARQPPPPQLRLALPRGEESQPAEPLCLFQMTPSKAPGGTHVSWPSKSGGSSCPTHLLAPTDVEGG